MLGGKVIYKSGGKEATIKLCDTTIELTVNSDKIIVDGKEEIIPKVVKPYQDSLLIPLKLILANTNIKHVYDSKYNQVNIVDNRVTIKNIVKNAQVEQQNNDSKADSAIQLMKYNISTDGLHDRITGINVSNKVIRKGEAEIRTQMVLYKNDGTLRDDFTEESDNYSKRTHPILPAVDKGGVVQRDKISVSITEPESIAYIFSTGRLNPYFED